MVLQDPFAPLNPRMTIEQALGELLRMHGLLSSPALRQRVQAPLLSVGPLADGGRRYPRAVSGGQRQHTVIAWSSCITAAWWRSERPSRSAARRPSHTPVR